MNKKIIGLVIVSALLSACSLSENEEPLTSLTRTDSQYDIKYDRIEDVDVSQEIYINETKHTLNSKNLPRFMYTDKNNTEYPAGMPLIIKEGNTFKLDVINNTAVDTNIHWHGLSLANDQDGPALLIDKNGGTYSYEFTPEYSGSYWYHSHNRPVRDQVDFGMHGPLVVVNESDKQYSLDRILMLDDWIADRVGGHMQVEGDVDTVNGVTGDDIEPLIITNNDFVKLRLIQASTAKNTTLYFPFPVRVTHTDGILLEEPYEISELELSPGERYDIDFKVSKEKDQNFIIRNERNNGLKIPIQYKLEEEKESVELIKPQIERIDDFTFTDNDLFNIEVHMDSTMSHGMGHEWTINGEVFPNAEEFNLKLNQEYIIRFYNDSSMFNHPMHIHGSHFKVLNINGIKTTTTQWKDTINVLPNEYVDVAIKFENPGNWMMHCHILDHEDGGMMTTIIVD